MFAQQLMGQFVDIDSLIDLTVFAMMKTCFLNGKWYEMLHILDLHL